MKYSLCADIMFVGVGEHGPIWPGTDGVIAAMQLAKQHGLDGIELFSLEGRDLQKLATTAKELGLTIVSAVPDKGVLLGDPTKVDELTEDFRKNVAFAQTLGCKNLVLNADGYDKSLPHEEVKQVIINTVKSLAPIAAEGGITILLEPLTGGFYQSAEEAFEIIRAIDCENVKLVYDIFHFQNICGQLSESIKANLPLIGDIHGAGGPMRGELTAGEINYPYLLSLLKELGYEGNFCLEFFTFQNREEKVAASCSILV